MSAAMPPHSTKQELEGYISGLLSTDDNNLVHTHLEQCEECQLKLAEVAMETQWTDRSAAASLASA